MLDVLHFDFNQCLRETEELEALLASKPLLRERDDILPFFKARRQLSAYIGSYIPDIISYNRVAHEFRLGGSFVCDLAVGDWERRHYAFVEFEDAQKNSLFRQKRGKATPEWAPRLEHGFSQLVDWFFQIEDIKGTADFEEVFGTGPVDYVGILIVGRAQELGPREQRRLKWRQTAVQVNGKRIYCKTFDQLCSDLRARLESLRLIAENP